MDALATAAIGLLVPYLVKGAEEFSKEAGEAAFSGVQMLFGKLQEWWNGEPVAKATAENLASNPKKYSVMLSELLCDKLQSDPAFAENIRQLVDGLGPNIQVIQKMEVAEGITGADIKEIVGGHLSVYQESKNAKDVVGVKSERMGG